VLGQEAIAKKAIPANPSLATAASKNLTREQIYKLYPPNEARQLLRSQALGKQVAVTPNLSKASPVKIQLTSDSDDDMLVAETEKIELAFKGNLFCVHFQGYKLYMKVIFQF